MNTPKLETVPSEDRPGPVDRDGQKLLVLSFLGIAITAAASAVVLSIFVRIIDGQGSWWKLHEHHLQQGQWYEAARVTVALVALTVGGGAAYLAYRRQRTADENQKTTAKTHLITANAFQLSVDQRADAQRRELRTRFTDAATQLAHASAAVRIAGVYAMAALADDWHSRNEYNEVQTCVDVLCGYLRLPYIPEYGGSHQTKRIVTKPRTHPDGTAAAGNVEEHYEYRQNDREVRKTIVRTIVEHLQKAAKTTWSDQSFDFKGALLEDADFALAIFRGERTSFDQTQFRGERTSFDQTQFRGERTSFDQTQFRGERTSFAQTQFHSDNTSFAQTQFHSDNTSFGRARFHGERTSFSRAQFHGKRTLFDGARFNGENTFFDGTWFHSKLTRFGHVQFHGDQTSFHQTQFHGKQTSFEYARFHSEQTSFEYARFHSEQTSFEYARFHGKRTLFDETQFHSENTSFARVQFHSERTSFMDPGTWHHVFFDWDTRPPLAMIGPKPDSVLPADWPPKVLVPQE